MKEELIRPDKGQAAIAIHLVNKDGFAEFAKANKMNVVKKIRLSNAFQAKLVALDYDDEFR